MSRDRLAELQNLAELAYQREYREALPVLQEEQRLAGRLAQLDDMTRPRPDARMAAVGADMAWLAWADAERRRISIELAAARARRMQVTDRLSKALDRREAVQALYAKARADARVRRQRRGLEDLLERSMKGPGPAR